SRTISAKCSIVQCESLKFPGTARRMLCIGWLAGRLAFAAIPRRAVLEPSGSVKSSVVSPATLKREKSAGPKLTTLCTPLTLVPDGSSASDSACQPNDDCTGSCNTCGPVMTSLSHAPPNTPDSRKTVSRDLVRL